MKILVSNQKITNNKTKMIFSIPNYNNLSFGNMNKQINSYPNLF